MDDLKGAPIPLLPTGISVSRITCANGGVIRNGDVRPLDAVVALQFAAQLRSPDVLEFCRADLCTNAQFASRNAVLILDGAGVLRTTLHRDHRDR